MRLIYSFCLFTIAFLFICSFKAQACGYGFVGDCSTQIKLRINNSLDSFKIAECPSGPYFNGLQLGTIQSLNLAGGNSINWESCFNNVTGVSLRYRIHEQGQPGAAWFDLQLQEDYNTLVGPYTTRYRSANSNINLVTGLTVGTKYVLEVYFLAQIDTLGDDFIPETTLAQNNGGLNYHLTFTYGGANAGPFTVVNTHVQDLTCYGDSTGVAGVTVYGNQNNLFYTWSSVGGNFYSIYNIAAGTYTVTVSGVNGYTQSSTMLVNEPVAITKNVTATICAGSSYEIGNQSFSQPGTYTARQPSQSGCDTIIYLTLQVIDPGAALANLPTNILLTCNQPSLNLCATVAPDVTYSWSKDGGAVVTQPCLLATAGGTYRVTATYTAGNITCVATQNILSAEHLQSPTASYGGVATLNCGNIFPDSVTFYATTNAQGAIYRWTLNGQVISTAAICTAVLLADGSLPMLLVTDQYGCSTQATPNLFVVVGTSPTIQVVADKDLCNGLHEIKYGATGGAGPYAVRVDNVSIAVNPFTATAGYHEFELTDANGCIVNSGFYIIPFAATAAVLNATSSNAANGSIDLTITGGDAPVSIQWNTGQTSSLISNLLPGTYCVTVSENNNCTFDTCFIVSYTNSTVDISPQNLQIFPNPVRSGGTLELILPEQFIGTEMKFEILDDVGRVLKSELFQALQSRKSVFLPENAASGVYLTRLSNATNHISALLLVNE